MALVEIALIAFSYVLMFVIALLCVALPVLGFILSDRQFLLICIFMEAVGATLALSILRSLLPSKAPPRPQHTPINLEEQPRFQKFIAEIAASFHQPAPTEALLVTNSIAYIFEKRGRFGFGGTRCIVIGMPLFACLSEPELRAVVAQEFVRSLYSGETRQATNSNPSRTALGRILVNLSETKGSKDWLTSNSLGSALRGYMLFALTAYWKLLLRLTQAISRLRTFYADDICCRVAGAAATHQSLITFEQIRVIEKPFWPELVAPCITAGFRPPLTDTLTRLLTSRLTADMLNLTLGRQFGKLKPDPFDHEPPLTLRLQRISQFQSEPGLVARPDKATHLLDDWDNLERSLLKGLILNGKIDSLRLLNWETEGGVVFSGAWRRFLAQHERLFTGQTVNGVPAIVAIPLLLPQKFPIPKAYYSRASNGLSVRSKPCIQLYLSASSIMVGS